MQAGNRIVHRRAGSDQGKTVIVAEVVWLRSKAWICDFSSTHSTIAWLGGDIPAVAEGGPGGDFGGGGDEGTGDLEAGIRAMARARVEYWRKRALKAPDHD